MNLLWHKFSLAEGLLGEGENLAPVSFPSGGQGPLLPRPQLSTREPGHNRWVLSISQELALSAESVVFGIRQSKGERDPPFLVMGPWASHHLLFIHLRMGRQSSVIGSL